MAAPDPSRPLRVVSVSLGSSSRDAVLDMELLGRAIRLERVGVNGNVREAARKFEELRDEVDAFGLGGTDLFLEVAGRKYAIRESARLVRHAGSTPVVCGVGLKHTLERQAVKALSRDVAWAGKRVLLPSAVDRWGMAEGLADEGAALTIGDLAFLLGLPLGFHDLTRFAGVVRVIAPVVTQFPIAWIYPTGAKQESRVTGWRERWFDEAQILAGDWHLLARYAPHRLDGKIVLTNTTTKSNLDDLAGRGVQLVATTTPRIEGRSLPTNLLEAAFVALAGRGLLSREDLMAMVQEAALQPDVWRATPPPNLEPKLQT